MGHLAGVRVKLSALHRLGLCVYKMLSSLPDSTGNLTALHELGLCVC